jgi:hypothetical protein
LINRSFQMSKRLSTKSAPKSKLIKRSIYNLKHYPGYNL